MELAEDAIPSNTQTNMADFVFLIPAMKQPKFCCPQENVKIARRLTILMNKVESVLNKTARIQEKSGLIVGSAKTALISRILMRTREIVFQILAKAPRFLSSMEHANPVKTSFIQTLLNVCVFKIPATSPLKLSSSMEHAPNAPPIHTQTPMERLVFK